MSTGAAARVSIVIPAFNKWSYTARCLASLAQHTAGIAHEVIVIDNASTDETPRAITGFPGVRHERNAENLGFARACNQGARLATAPYLLFLNNDTEVLPGWLAPMVAILDAAPEVAVVGNKLLFPDGTIQHAGVALSYAAPDPIRPFHRQYRQPASAGDKALELSAVTAACMLIRADAFWAAGGFDEGYVNGYEDVDLCLKVREARRKIVYTPSSLVVHHESVSEGRFLHAEANLSRLTRRWIDRFDAFDVDFRRTTPMPAVDPMRPGVSVVVAFHDALATIAPCLENIRYGMGPQDQLVLVDNGSRDASGEVAGSFARRYAAQVHLVQSALRVPVATALRVGIDAARSRYIALVAPNVKVVPGWLDRAMAELAREPSTELLCARLGDPTPLTKMELFFPLQPALERAPESAGGGEIAAPPVFALLGERDRVAALVTAAQGARDRGEDMLAAAGRAHRRGVHLRQAREAVVYRFDEPSPRPDPAIRLATVAQHSLSAEERPLLSVLVPASGSAEDAAACVAALVRHTPGSPELIVIDQGGPGDRAPLDAALERAHGRVAVISGAGGAPARLSDGVAAARGTYVAVVEPDALVTAGWADRLVSLLEAAPELDAVAPLTSATAAPQGIGPVPYKDHPGLDDFAAEWAARRGGDYIPVATLAGPCRVVRRGALAALGLVAPGDGDRAGASVPGRRLRFALAFDAFVHRGPLKGAPAPARAASPPAPQPLTVMGEGMRIGPGRSRRTTVPIAPIARAARVSVIVPCHNYGRYLRQSLGSVLLQTFVDLEVIIVDDGSTDDTTAVAEALMAAHANRTIRLISQPRSGHPSFSRNRGIRESHGEYILCLDADDMIDPTMIDECVQVLDANPRVGIAYTDQCSFDDTTYQVVLTNEYDRERLLEQNQMPCCALFRRKAWEVTGGYKNVGYEDWEFWIACAKAGFTGKRIPKPLFFYREKRDGRFQADRARDQRIRAELVLLHPELYGPTRVAEARRLLAMQAAG